MSGDFVRYFVQVFREFALCFAGLCVVRGCVPRYVVQAVRSFAWCCVGLRAVRGCVPRYFVQVVWSFACGLTSRGLDPRTAEWLVACGSTMSGTSGVVGWFTKKCCSGTNTPRTIGWCGMTVPLHKLEPKGILEQLLYSIPLYSLCVLFSCL